MARGRMINSKITLNKAIHDLSDDTSRLAFTWLITFADAEGRTYGDPAVVRSMLFPRRTDVTAEQMAGYIREWQKAGLIEWYEAEGDLWIAFPKFEENQRGLDRRKEPTSTIPAPPEHAPDPHEVRTEYVPSTEDGRTEYVPGTAEQNRTESELNATAPAAGAPEVDITPSEKPERARAPTDALRAGLFKALKDAGVMPASQVEAEQWLALLEVSADLTLIRQTLAEAVAQGKRRPSVRYVHSILTRCVTENCRPGEWPEDARARASPRWGSRKSTRAPVRDWSKGLTPEEERMNAVALAELGSEDTHEEDP